MPDAQKASTSREHGNYRKHEQYTLTIARDFLKARDRSLRSDARRLRVTHQESPDIGFYRALRTRRISYYVRNVVTSHAPAPVYWDALALSTRYSNARTP